MSVEATSSMSVKVGSFAKRSGTGTQSVSGVGFQPKLVLFWMNDLTSDGNQCGGRYGFGAATSTSNRFWTGHSAEHDTYDDNNPRVRASVSACSQPLSRAAAGPRSPVPNTCIPQTVTGPPNADARAPVTCSPQLT